MMAVATVAATVAAKVVATVAATAAARERTKGLSVRDRSRRGRPGERSSIGNRGGDRSGHLSLGRKGGLVGN